jgi:hypothetical protein
MRTEGRAFELFDAEGREPGYEEEEIIFRGPRMEIRVKNKPYCRGKGHGWLEIG